MKNERVGIDRVGAAKRRRQLIDKYSEALPELVRPMPMEQWASDHAEEAKHYTGWNYIAIQPICRMASRAATKAYDDGDYETSSFLRTKRASMLIESQFKNVVKSFTGDEEGNLLEDTHECYRLLYQPNRSQNAAIFRWQHIQQLHIHGVSLAFNCPTIDGRRIAERFVLPITYTRPIYAGDYEEFPNGGVRVVANARTLRRLGSRFNKFSGLGLISGLVIPAEMLSVYLYPNVEIQGEGTSPTSAIGSWIDLSEAVDQARLRHMARGPTPKVLVTPMPEHLTSARTLEDWQRRISDYIKSSDSDVIGVPHQGATLLGFTAEEMAYESTFEQMGKATLAAHGTSMSVAGLLDTTTYGAAAAAYRAFTALTVQSDLDILADEDTRTLSKDFGEGWSVQYIAPTFDDPELLERQLEVDTQAGIRTVDEMRKVRGLQPLGGKRGNRLIGEPIEPEGGNQTAEELARLLSAGKEPPKESTDPKEAEKEPVKEALGKDASKAMSLVIDYDGTLYGNPQAGQWASVIKSLRRNGMKVAMHGADDGEIEAFADSHGIELDAVPDVRESLYWDGESQGDLSPAQLLKCLARDRKSGFVYKSESQPSLGCLLAPIEGEARESLCRYWPVLDNSGECYEIEEDPHITLLYGLAGVSESELYSVVSRLAPIPVTFGKLDIFRASESRLSDVLHVTVESAELMEARKQLENRLPWLKSYSSYRPHATLAYMVPGASVVNRLEEIVPLSFTIRSIEFSRAKGMPRFVIPLRG